MRVSELAQELLSHLDTYGDDDVDVVIERSNGAVSIPREGMCTRVQLNLKTGKDELLIVLLST